jgi:ribosomal protein S17
MVFFSTNSARTIEHPYAIYVPRHRSYTSHNSYLKMNHGHKYKIQNSKISKTKQVNLVLLMNF